MQKQNSTVFWAEICLTFSPNREISTHRGYKYSCSQAFGSGRDPSPSPRAKQPMRIWTGASHSSSVLAKPRKSRCVKVFSLLFFIFFYFFVPSIKLIAAPRTRNKGPRSEAPLRKHTQTRSGDEVRSPRQLFSPDNLTFIWGVYP